MEVRRRKHKRGGHGHLDQSHRGNDDDRDSVGVVVHPHPVAIRYTSVVVILGRRWFQLICIRLLLVEERLCD